MSIQILLNYAVTGCLPVQIGTVATNSKIGSCVSAFCNWRTSLVGKNRKLFDYFCLTSNVFVRTRNHAIVSPQNSSIESPCKWPNMQELTKYRKGISVGLKCFCRHCFGFFCDRFIACRLMCFILC